VAEELGAGKYVFPAVEAGDHRLLVYGEEGTVSDEELRINLSFAAVSVEVMNDLCITTEITRVRGKVRSAAGKPVRGARVAVEDLLLETTTDDQGRYVLSLPPGSWELTAEAAGARAALTVEAEVPDDCWPAPQEITRDLKLDR
jgi:hypothetical protein